MDPAAPSALPVAPCVGRDDNGAPCLTGHRCAECQAVYLEPRTVCSRCFSRDRIEPTRLAEKGHLYTFSIVHRSYPGIEVPYISAIVDLEGGGTIKGNLMGVDPDPASIEFDMPVKVVFGDALGRKDADGNSYVSYFFQPL